MKVVLLTSDNLRHKYVANALAGELELKLIITEAKSQKIEDSSGYRPKDAAFISDHFKARSESEKQFFGAYNNFPTDVPLLEVPHGAINSQGTYEAIEKADPEVLVLFGTSIIKDPLLKEYSGEIINLHLGLSPYYKGSATNLFPYYYEEPECIGASIHLATSKVDEGDVLHQLRPEINEKDSLHDIGNRTILQAGKIVPQVIRSYINRNIEPVKQENTGRICRNKDLSPALLREIYRKFEAGLIPDYLKNKKQRDQKKPILQQL